MLPGVRVTGERRYVSEIEASDRWAQPFPRTRWRPGALDFQYNAEPVISPKPTDTIVHADWLEALEQDCWDRQIEEDFAPGGRGSDLID
jgi:hypothetical protein